MAGCGCSNKGGTTSVVVATTGGTTTPTAGVSVVEFTPAGTIATQTLTLPLTTHVFDDEILILTTQTITALTVGADAGATVAGMPTTLAANSYFRVRLFGTVWRRVG